MINIFFFFSKTMLCMKQFVKFCKRGRRLKIWRINIACWIIKATHTNKYVIFIVFVLQQLLQVFTPVLSYSHIAFLVIFSYITYTLTCVFPDNGIWRMQPVGGNKELDVYAWCMWDVGHKKIKQISFKNMSNQKLWTWQVYGMYL